MVEYEFHEVARKEPLTYEEIAQFGCQNWCLYAADPPAGPDHAWAYHFRRVSGDGPEPDRRPAPKLNLKGGVDRDRGPRLCDLAGRYTPIRLRRD